MRKGVGASKIRLPDGKVVGTTDMDFKIESDPETKLKLDDGSVLQIRISITKVSRLEGIHDVVTGDPIYYVQSQPIIRVKANPKLRELK